VFKRKKIEVFIRFWCEHMRRRNFHYYYYY